MTRFPTKFTVLLFLLVLPLLAACAAQVDTSHLPDYVQAASQRVQVAYQYAVDHSEMLEHQPCYCGCGAMGHLNNLDCFVQSVSETGEIIYDSHASGCGICVDIALDAKRLAEEGRTPLQVRLYIDATYSQFGPSTDTPMPEA